jgi:hypothetical protein
MTRYFARLVQRTLGIERTALAAPATFEARTRTEAGDPFEATAALELTPPVQRPGQLPAERIEPARPASHLPVEIGSPPVRPPSVDAGAPLTELPAQAEPPRITPASEAPRAAQAALEVKETQRREVVEHTRIDHELRRETARVTPDIEALPPRVSSIPEREPKEVKTPQALAVPSKVEPQVFVPVMPPEGRTESVRPLEPLRSEPSPSPPVSPAQREEPRLVIGRMEIDVVTAAPPAALPVPRAPRPRGSSSAPTSSVSQVQFGLGQM